MLPLTRRVTVVTFARQASLSLTSLRGIYAVPRMLTDFFFFLFFSFLQIVNWYAEFRCSDSDVEPVLNAL
jgi:hypothetical protein